jgi:predicted Holliday junction resolvase-like endonuclease
MWTGAVFCFVLIIFIIVMAVDKCRRKKKRITEIVELKPVDLDEHRKGIAERNAAAVARQKAQRKALKPIMQQIDDDDRNASSRGASRYKSDEVDVSASARPLRATD